MITGDGSREEHLRVVAFLEKKEKRGLVHWNRSLPLTEAQWRRVKRRRNYAAAAAFAAPLPFTAFYPQLIPLCLLVFLLPELLPQRYESCFASLGYESQAITRAVKNLPRAEKKAHMERLRALGKQQGELIASKDTDWILEKGLPRLQRAYAELSEEVGAVGEKGPEVRLTDDAPQAERGGDDWIRISHGGRSVAYNHAKSIGWMTATPCCGHAIAQSIIGLACYCGRPYFGPDGSEEDRLFKERLLDLTNGLRSTEITDEDALDLASTYLPLGPMEKMLLLSPVEAIREDIIKDKEASSK